MKMENIIKGWLTSLLGLAGAIITVLHYFGVVSLPNPEALSTAWETVLAAIISLGFFMIPYSKIEAFVESAWEILLKMLNKRNDSEPPK